jgi:hypothetical protein
VRGFEPLASSVRVISGSPPCRPHFPRSIPTVRSEVRWREQGPLRDNDRIGGYRSGVPSRGRSSAPLGRTNQGTARVVMLFPTEEMTSAPNSEKIGTRSAMARPALPTFGLLVDGHPRSPPDRPGLRRFLFPGSTPHHYAKRSGRRAQAELPAPGRPGPASRARSCSATRSPGHRSPIMMRQVGASRNSARQRPPGRLTEVIVEESGAGADRQSILQFMTTEHFTLQTARAVANAEISSRLQLYLGTCRARSSPWP